MSYGFAIEDNIDDTVLLKFLPALSGGQLHLRRRQILEEQDTGLYHLHKSSPHPPLPLIHLFHILVANPREIEILQQNPTIEIVSLRNEVATKKQLVFALNAKYNRISDERENPHTNAEQFITIYRRGQCDILLDALTMLRNETKQIMSRPEVYPLAQLLLEQPFRDGIEACFGDIGELAENGLEDKVFVLGLCRKYLDSLRNSNRQDNWSRFFEKMGNAYSEHIQTGEGGESQGEAEEFYDDMFPAAAEAAPEVFGDGGGAWTVGLVTWMMKIYQGEVIEINNGYYLFMD